MSFARKLSLFSALVACLLLSACGGSGWGMGRLSWPGGGQQQFHPLDSEVAAMAAPAGAGPRLICRAGRGTALFGKAWAPFEETGFSIPAGSRINITLNRHDNRRGVTQMQGLFDKEGQKIIFCPVVEGPPDARIACTSLYALDDDLAAGLKRTFDIPELVRGASITCAFAAENLKKLD
jgi:hypothetical protein